MQDDKDFDYNGRKSKIENFELNIDHKYDNEKNKNDIMSYSNNKNVHRYYKNIGFEWQLMEQDRFSPT